MSEPEPAREVSGDEVLAALCDLEGRHVRAVVTAKPSWHTVAQLVGYLGLPAGGAVDGRFGVPILERRNAPADGGSGFAFPVDEVERATIDDEPGPGRHGDGTVSAEFADWRVTVRPTGRE